MAKRPVAGLVKRRLARDIGDVAATRFYRATLARTISRLGADPRWRTYLAIAPDTALTSSCWPSGAEAARIPQGAGDLGQRMQALFDSLPPGPVIIVGSDIPRICSTHIASAFRLLGDADAVFGPAADGGYWLVGMKRSPRILRPFDGIPWSTGAALDATLANLCGRNIAFAPVLTDVDTGKDYRSERQHAERLVTSCDG
jgi:rSAM/selenodomain-associated transferase 1